MPSDEIVVRDLIVLLNDAVGGRRDIDAVMMRQAAQQLRRMQDRIDFLHWTARQDFRRQIAAIDERRKLDRV